VPIDVRRVGSILREVTWLAESWQWIVVALIELAALVYLGRKLFGPTTPRARRGPDVPVSALVRKKK
jgi:hypothetical protein